MNVFQVALSLIYKIVPSPIFAALSDARLDEVEVLMKSPHHLLSRDKWGFTPLMIAIRERHTKIGLKMIDLGSPVNYVSRHGASPLSVAAMAGDIQIGDALIKKGANLNQKLSDPDGAYVEMTALMWATNRRHPDFVRLLLENGADINLVNGKNEAAIIFARDGTAESNTVLEVLAQFNPDLYVKDWRGRTIIDEARDRDLCSAMPEMKNILNKYFPSISI